MINLQLFAQRRRRQLGAAQSADIVLGATLLAVLPVCGWMLASLYASERQADGSDQLPERLIDQEEITLYLDDAQRILDRNVRGGFLSLTRSVDDFRLKKRLLDWAFLATEKVKERCREATSLLQESADGDATFAPLHRRAESIMRQADEALRELQRVEDEL